MKTRNFSERRACALVGLSRATQQYKSKRPSDLALRKRLHQVAVERPRFGYRRLCVVLRRQGLKVNHKRVQRLYREEELALRRRKRRRICAATVRTVVMPWRSNMVWAMDFVSDALSNGRRLRCLTLVDTFTRECLARPSRTRSFGFETCLVLLSLWS